ncbi:hypothetical protein ROJ8625_00720 [Roseivivax jejudonensis]|uniref:Uncharacterized protein n=1 Tax=Roseivivax jejudonensis TaxID=1529041 RepID=A0A1X6YGI3_9RHOB|nr:hypothetical protein [Roseivivax jejudonensis]SLN20156.1 hypothetical protein ROJ8625_00720 [Roseivivax jejudonensis]
MINRLAGAILRAILVALVVALPAVALPGLTGDASQMVLLAALAAALLTVVEYNAVSPSLVEFRSAPPYNRLRFVMLTIVVLVLTILTRHATIPSQAGAALTGLGATVGQAMDFPFSPVRLILLDLPADAGPESVALVRAAAGIAYFVSLMLVIFFVVLVRLLNWPIRKNAFNVLVNLPLFDPTAGGDVLSRLKRDAHFNVALGFLLPFLIPAAIKAAADFGSVTPFSGPLTLVWVMTAWAFLPASLMMRGVALMRIADLIEEKRRRAYAQSEQLQPA